MTAPDSAPTDPGLLARSLAARRVAQVAGAHALDLFRRRASLVVESKGVQDMVTRADREVETLLRDALAAEFPGDGFIGEEHGGERADARFVWVIDPIDGTACFVNGMHAWCVSVALLMDGQPAAGVVYDPNSGELFHGLRGHGAWLGDERLAVLRASSVRDGILGAGISMRVPPDSFLPFVGRLLDAGGMFMRNGSGALMLTYVAAGRMIGYYEPHINAWDCLAAVVLVREAGGVVNDFLADNGLHTGNPILAAGPTLYEPLMALTGLSLGRMPG